MVRQLLPSLLPVFFGRCGHFFRFFVPICNPDSAVKSALIRVTAPRNIQSGKFFQAADMVVFSKKRFLPRRSRRKDFLPEKYKNVEAGREVFVMNRQKRLENDVRFW